MRTTLYRFVNMGAERKKEQNLFYHTHIFKYKKVDTLYKSTSTTIKTNYKFNILWESDDKLISKVDDYQVHCHWVPSKGRSFSGQYREGCALKKRAVGFLLSEGCVVPVTTVQRKNLLQPPVVNFLSTNFSLKKYSESTVKFKPCIFNLIIRVGRKKCVISPETL